MKNAFLTVFLMLIVFVSTVQAQSFTLKIGHEFAMADVGLVNIGPIELGVAGAVDYFVKTNNSFKDLDLDFGDNYIGPVIKLHLLDTESVWDPYLAFMPMLRNGNINHRIYNVLEAGVNLFMCDHVGIGLAYQRCEEFAKKDRLMISLPVRF